MPREPHDFVYVIESSSRRVLYLGMTNMPAPPHLQAQDQECEEFTGRYEAVRLVYRECFDDVHKAIAREKQSKIGAERRAYG